MPITTPRRRRSARFSSLITVTAGLVTLIVMCFMLLVTEGAHIAAAYRFGNAGTNVTAVTSSDETSQAQLSAHRFPEQLANFVKANHLAVAYAAAQSPRVVTIIDPDGFFGDDIGPFVNRLGAPVGKKSRVLLSAALGRDVKDTGSIMYRTLWGLDELATADIAGIFSPKVQLHGVYPLVIAERTRHYEPGTFTFAGHGDPALLEDDVKAFFAGDNITVEHVSIAGPKSGSTFAASTRGKLSVLAAILLVVVGVGMAVFARKVSAMPAPLFARRVIAATIVTAAVAAMILAGLAPQLFIVGHMRILMVGAITAISCIIVWIVITFLTALFIRRRGAGQ